MSIGGPSSLNDVPPCKASRTGVGKLVSGNPGYCTNAISTITKAPIKCPTCSGPGGIPRNGLAPSPSNALTVPYSAASKFDSSASAKGCSSIN